MVDVRALAAPASTAAASLSCTCCAISCASHRGSFARLFVSSDENRFSTT